MDHDIRNCVYMCS